MLALNMPAGSNPALARAVGVMLKNAWLQALLMRPAKMKERPSRYCRPAVFICDEYQAFASVNEDDPSGDEKSFALTRQCRCIPIVATQSGLAPVWWTVLSLSFSTSCSRRCGNCGSRVAASKRRWESRSDFQGLVSFHNG